VLFVALLPIPTTALDAVHNFTGLPSAVVLIAAVAGVLLILSINQKNAAGNYFTNGIQVELWEKYIVERLWKDNPFLTKAWNADEYVLQGKVVHIPQPGAKPNVVKNRSSLPATAVTRTDTDYTFSLDQYTTDPTILPDADKKQLSYDKMNSIYGDHAGVLGDTIGDDILIKWAPSTTLGTQIRTTGGPNADTVAAAGSVQTGTRLGFHALDLKKAMTKMNTQNVPKEGRVCMIDANMYDYFLSSFDTNQMAAYQQTADLANGIVGRLYGFDIMERSNVLQYSSALVVNALGAAGAATDELASLCWHPDSVIRALGSVQFFANPNQALYYGDLYSAVVYMGGIIRRADGLGIVAIIQA
jgi:hypothetical protein